MEEITGKKEECKKIYCRNCKRRIDEEYLEDPKTGECCCLSCAGKIMDSVLKKYPTAIAD